jgi:hypothetical protein
MVAERLLQWAQLLACETLDRLDGGAVGLDREQHAALHERPVDDHAAGAAVAGVAPDVGSGEVEIVAKEVDQQPPRVDLALVHRAVDVDADRLGRDGPGRDLGHPAARFAACSTARAATTSASACR